MTQSNLSVVKDKQANGSGFALQPKNMAEAMEVAQMLASSALVPKDYKNKPGDTLVAMMMGTEIGLNAIQSLQNIAVINGRPSIWGDAMLALVQKSAVYGSIKESVDTSTMTATCIVTRKGSEPHTVTYSQQDAAQAGLWDKQGPWKQHPKRMLQMRARGFALRDQFSDVLLGLIAAEEAIDMPPRDINEPPHYSQSASNVAEEPQQALLYEYPKELYESNKSTYVDLINSGKPVKNIINKIESKYTMTEEQKKDLRSYAPKTEV